MAGLVFLLGMAAAEWESFNGLARVTRGPELLYSKEFGFLNIPYQDPMPSDAVFPVASNTKLYVAVALYQLQEAGKVDLNKSVAEYLDATDFASFGMNRSEYCPRLPGTSECQVVRFVDLLAMSSGIPNLDMDEFLPYPGSIGLVVGDFLDRDLLFVPGTAYNYSNSNFILAGYFVEKFSGTSLREYLARHIFSVVGQTSTEYDPYNYKLGMSGFRRKRVYEYYQYRDPKTRKAFATGECSSELDLGTVNGAGGVLSTAADQQLFYYSLFNFSAMGKPLLQDPRSLIDLVRPRMAMSAATTGPGYFYYAQGVASLCSSSNSSSSCAPIPELLEYEGGTICVTTYNLFDRRVEPPAMTSVFRSMEVFYTEEELVQKLQDSRNGSFEAMTAGFAKTMPVRDMAYFIHKRHVYRAMAPPRVRGGRS